MARTQTDPKKRRAKPPASHGTNPATQRSLEQSPPTLKILVLDVEDMLPCSNNRILIEDRVTAITLRSASGFSKIMQDPRILEQDPDRFQALKHARAHRIRGSCNIVPSRTLPDVCLQVYNCRHFKASADFPGQAGIRFRFGSLVVRSLLLSQLQGVPSSEARPGGAALFALCRMSAAVCSPSSHFVG